MVKVVRGTNKNKSATGIHLFQPTKRQVQDAKEDAENKGFSRVYVHRTKRLIVGR